MYVCIGLTHVSKQKKNPQTDRSFATSLYINFSPDKAGIIFLFHINLRSRLALPLFFKKCKAFGIVIAITQKSIFRNPE